MARNEMKEPSSTAPNGRSRVLIAVMLVLGIQAVVVRGFLLVSGGELSGPMASLVFGVGILGAAFLLTWAAEVAEMDVSASLALAFLALIAVLPEYAVDMYFAWQAGQNPVPFIDPASGRLVDYASYATANMTGANRLLVGFGWPVVILLFVLIQRRRWARRNNAQTASARASGPAEKRPPLALNLERALSLEIIFLLLATLYAFIIPLMREIAWWDAIVFVGLFAAYMWLGSRAPKEEPELVGPAAAIGSLPKTLRRITVVGLFLFAGLVIFGGAEPFAEGLIHTGRQFGINEFLLVQWLAPLASESPEMIVAVLFTLRGTAGAAMTALISSKVNQWTLLIGTLPLVYSISLGKLSGLPMNPVQREEVLLTAAQSLFAVAILARMRIGWVGASALLLLFVGQLSAPLYTASEEAATQVRYYFSYVYLVLAVSLVLVDRARLVGLWRMGKAVLATATGRNNLEGHSAPSHHEVASAPRTHKRALAPSGSDQDEDED